MSPPGAPVDDLAHVGDEGVERADELVVAVAERDRLLANGPAAVLDLVVAGTGIDRDRT
jgi:hypothetical protein